MKKLTTFLCTGLLCATFLGTSNVAEAKSFSDVPSNSWYYEKIDFVTERNLIDGVSNDQFQPEAGLTRGIFVTMLGRMADVNKSEYTSSNFTDVNFAEDYAPYVAWAVEHGITAGKSDTSFGTNDFITRQEMATMIQKYLIASDTPVLPTVYNGTFSDWSTVSEWAKENILKMREINLMVGDEQGNFNPHKNLTRGEGATIIATLIQEDEENRKLLGVFEGTYDPNQGLSGCTFTINAVNRTYAAVFDFYSLPGKTNCKDGAYTMEITKENGNIVFTGKEWQDYASSYVFVDFVAGFDGNTFKSTSGTAMEVSRIATNQEEIASIVGSYHGLYGIEGTTLTNLDLTISVKGSGYQAIFAFYNPNDGKSGSYYMDVTPYGNGKIQFTAGDWIEEPVNYVRVDGTLYVDGDTLSGNFFGEGQSTALTVEVEKIS